MIGGGIGCGIAAITLDSRVTREPRRLEARKMYRIAMQNSKNNKSLAKMLTVGQTTRNIKGLFHKPLKVTGFPLTTCGNDGPVTIRSNLEIVSIGRLYRGEIRF